MRLYFWYDPLPAPRPPLMAAAPLRFLSVRVTTDELNEHRRRVPLDQPRIDLVLAVGNSPNTRTAPLTEDEALGLITTLSAALRKVRQ